MAARGDSESSLPPQGDPMATIQVGPARGSSRSVKIAAAVSGTALLALAVALRDVPELSATSTPTRDDQDRDGLGDLQELVLRTMPTVADTDGDTYSDFEEHARGSEQIDAGSIPNVGVEGGGVE